MYTRVVYRKARVYFKSEYICEYNYDLKTKEITITYPSSEVEQIFKNILLFLNKKYYYTPKEVVPFLLRMFDYLEIYNHKELARKKQKDGIFVILDNNLKFEYILVIDEYNKEIEKKIKQKYNNSKCYFVPADIDYFNVSDLFF